MTERSLYKGLVVGLTPTLTTNNGDMMKLVNIRVLKTLGVMPCGFDFHYPHHLTFLSYKFIEQFNIFFSINVDVISYPMIFLFWLKYSICKMNITFF